MTKYTQEVKDKAVAAAKEGMNLKEIQRTLGPNPKATERYLVKAGIDIKQLREKLKLEGKEQSVFKKQEKKPNTLAKVPLNPTAAKVKKGDKEPSTEVIEE